MNFELDQASMHHPGVGDRAWFGEIQKLGRLAEQAGKSKNKYTVNCIFVQKSRRDCTL